MAPRALGKGLWLFAALTLVACKESRPKLGRPDGGSVITVAPSAKPTELGAGPADDEHEPNDDVAHAGTLAPARAVRGKLQSETDIDLYRFKVPELVAGEVDGGAADHVDTRLKLATDNASDTKAEIAILDEQGRVVAVAKDVLPNVPLSPGRDYVARVRAASKQGAAYQLTVAFEASTTATGAPEVEPNNDRAHATLVGTSAPLTGYLTGAREEDWWKLDLSRAGTPPKDASLRIEIAPLADVALELRIETDSKQILADVKGGRSGELRLANVGLPSRPDFVWLMLRAKEGRAVDARYAIRVLIESALDGAEREPNADVAHATELPLHDRSASIMGYLWPGDSDVYRVVGPAGALLDAEVSAVDGVDLKLERLSAEGLVLARADDAGVGKGELLPPAASLAADALFRVSARGKDVAFDAPYQLSVHVVEADDAWEREPNDRFTTASPWKRDAQQMKGRCAPKGDVDYFSVPAGAETIPRINPSSVEAALVTEKDGRRYVRVSCGSKSLPREPYTLVMEPR